MRLLWLHQNLVTGSQAGNGRAGYTLAALLEAGWTVDLVAADHTYLGERIDEPAEQREGGLSLYRVPISTRNKGLAYGTFAARALALARRLPRPDLLFLSTPPLPGAAPALAWARRLRVPVLAEVRDLWPGFLLEGGLLRPGWGARSLEALEVAVVHGADRVVSVSPGFRPYLEALGASVEVAVTGCDPRFGLPSTAGAGRRRVVYTGSLNEAYGTDLLLDLVERRDDVDWVIAGAGRGRARVEDAARRLSQLTWLGALPRQRIPAVLAEAHAAVNLHASWPLLGTTITGKLFDYLAAGIGVLDLTGGQMRRIVERSGAGVSAPRDVSAASAALDRLLSDSEAGPRGQRFGLTHLNAWTEARRIADVARKAATGGPPRTRAMGRAVLRRSPAKTLAAVYQDGPGEVAAREFDTWLAGRSPRDEAPLVLPSILGGLPTTE